MNYFKIVLDLLEVFWDDILMLFTILLYLLQTKAQKLMVNPTLKWNHLIFVQINRIQKTLEGDKRKHEVEETLDK